MYKITKTYVDYDGNERTEDFFFNLTQAEVFKLNICSEGSDIEKVIKKIIKETNGKRLYEHFEAIVDMAYGEKSLDGRRFMKSTEILDNFKQTEAYSMIIIDLLNHENAIEFINNVLPKFENKEQVAPAAAIR